MPEQRDYVAEVREQVDKYLTEHETGMVSAEAAQELGTKWRATDPDLLLGWLMARWPSLLTDHISHLSRSRSVRARRTRVHAAFEEFSEEFDQSDDEEESEEAYRRWGDFYEVTVGETRVRKAFRALTAGELGQVKDGYVKRAAENDFYARVIGAVQERVARAGPGKTVGDVYTPDQLEAMFEH